MMHERSYPSLALFLQTPGDKMILHRRHAMGAMAAAVASTLPSFSQAQAYPSRPITIVIPYPPGASTDQLGRFLQQGMSANNSSLNVIAENRGGAAGILGSAYVAKSPPDGYRILLATQPIATIYPFLYKDMGFDPVKDLTPLTCGVNAVVALAVHPSLPVNNVAELIAFGKKNPGVLNFGTAGSGSPQHIGGLLFAQRAGFDLTHVPYKGGGPMVSDLLAGHIKMGIVTLSTVKAYAADKKLKVIAIGEKMRFPGAPDIPTIAETLPGFELTTWLGFFGPGGLPAEQVKYLTNAIIAALNSPDIKTKLLDLALPLRTEGPEALAKLVLADQDAYGRIIRDHKITAD
jgi:tripartite-type tricarboxylate transporter receptor subunit TctC